MVQVLVQRLLTAMAYRQQRQKFQVRPKTAGADFQALHLVATKLQLKRNKNEIETREFQFQKPKYDKMSRISSECAQLRDFAAER